MKLAMVPKGYTALIPTNSALAYAFFPASGYEPGYGSCSRMETGSSTGSIASGAFDSITGYGARTGGSKTTIRTGQTTSCKVNGVTWIWTEQRRYAAGFSPASADT